MSEHIILTAINVETDTREEAHAALLPRLVPLLQSRDSTSPIIEWWVAEDDRTDGSDLDSAVFVKPGLQREAVTLLRRWHLTGEHNVDGTEPTLPDVPPLPADEHGDLITSADFGTSYLVQITYNTEADGRPVESTDAGAELPQTLHGPFIDETEAQAWMDAYPDDPDVYDMVTLPLNNVRG